jgi:hypothetical protein
MAGPTNLGTISVVMFQEGEWWTAQCLEYDIAAQAETVPALCYEFVRVLFGHMVANVEFDREPFEGIGPAPEEYWHMFTEAKVHIQSDRLPFRVPPTLTAYMIPTTDLRIGEQKAA